MRHVSYLIDKITYTNGFLFKKKKKNTKCKCSTILLILVCQGLIMKIFEKEIIIYFNSF
jgi:hypothetical protein